jgi:hypothetical protein
MLKSSLEHGSRLKGNALATNATASPTIKSPAHLDVSNFSVEFLKAIMVRLKLLCCQMVEEIVKTKYKWLVYQCKCFRIIRG